MSLRGGVFSPFDSLFSYWSGLGLDSLSIVAGVNLGLMSKNNPYLYFGYFLDFFCF